MPQRVLFAVGTAYSVMVPEGVILPILLPVHSVNQRFPSAPEVILTGTLFAVGRGYSVMVPEGVILPILLASISVNQRFPSAPEVIPAGTLFAVGMAYSVMVPEGDRKSTRLNSSHTV